MQRSALMVLIVVLAAAAFVAAGPGPAEAGHSWGTYHWARTANPFTLKLGDNVSSTWDSYLITASADWSKSSVLDTTVVPGGTSGRRCRPTVGRIEVCNASYGNNGWLGLAQIWVSGSHITQGTAKMNDTYFNSATYNTPAWRRLVMCQEVAHPFGLGHQDENFNNPNLGSCMDYTSDPDGPPSNEHPNQHDSDQLVSIYSHLDSITTVGQEPAAAGAAGPDGEDGPNDPREFGRPAGPKDGYGRDILFVRELGGGGRLFTWVYWIRPGRPDAPGR